MPHRHRILFVDDEQSILDGLRDSLRKQRKVWDIIFAAGGQAALDELESSRREGKRIDVVVSDMRMPGMDGAALLARVKDMFPASTRIILSGHAEREAVIKALPVAHQFLSKPCDGEQLRMVLARACELQSLLGSELLRGFVGRIDKLPSVSETYWELTEAAARPETAMADLARIIERDVAMSAKVLQLVNSSYFGLAQRLGSVQQAVSYLGIELVKALAMVAHAFGVVADGGTLGPFLEALQRTALMTAQLGKRIFASDKLADQTFTACMIHDVGKIVLALDAPSAYRELSHDADRSGRPTYVVERERLGVTHAEVGAFLLGVWGLPMAIVEAVAFHHTPSLVQGDDLKVLAAVHIADALIDATVHGRCLEGPDALLDLPFVERVGLLPELPRLTELARHIVAGTRAD